jgi:predicted amidohydrolase
MKIYALQYDIAWEDKSKNFERVETLLADANPEPGSLIVLPEMFATGFSFNVNDIAEDVGGPTETFLTNLAQRHNVHIIGGVVTQGKTGRGRNEALLFNPQGKCIARYCKLHPFSFAGEDAHFESGEAVLTTPLQEFTLAPFICYDLRFPEIFRKATRAGANFFIIIANWPTPRAAHWRALLTARAIENQAYVIGLNRVGNDPNLPYSGGSIILDPQGLPLTEASDTEQILTAHLPLEPLQEYRQDFPALNDIREW